MKRSAEDVLLDRFAEALRDQTPVPTDAATQQQRIERALQASAQGDLRPAFRVPSPVLWAAATVLLTFGAWWIGRQGAVSGAGPGLAVMVLPSGDRLSITPDSDMTFSEEDPRALRLRQGRVLVDAVRQDSGAGFVVRTPHARIVTLGTVFAVSVDDKGTRVDVYEGRVAMVEDGKRREIGAHAFAVSSGTEVMEEHEGLRTVGRRAADARRLAARSAASDAVVRTPRSTTSAARSAAVPVPALEPQTQESPAQESPAPAPLALAEVPPEEPNLGQASKTVAPPGRPEVAPQVAQARQAPDPLGDPGTAPVADPSDAAAEARELLAAGHYDRVLRIAAENPARRRSGPWLMLAGDAHRGLEQWQAAKQAYDAASETLGGQAALRAAYLAAWVSHHRLHDRDEALRMLQRLRQHPSTGVTAERASLLLCTILVQGNQREAAGEACSRHLADYPNGSERAWVEHVLEQFDVQPD